MIRKFYQTVVVTMMEKYNSFLSINNDKKNNINNNHIDNIKMNNNNNMIKYKTKIPSPTKHKAISNTNPNKSINIL